MLEYCSVEGVVTNIIKANRYMVSKYFVRVSERDMPKEFQYSLERPYYIIQRKVFTRSTAPKVGDKVILRSRKTVDRPSFNPMYAKIVAVKERA